MLDTTPDFLPARMVNEYVYCPQLAYLEWVRENGTTTPARSRAASPPGLASSP